MMNTTKDVEDPLAAHDGDFPLGPIVQREDSITQAHVGKGEHK